MRLFVVLLAAALAAFAFGVNAQTETEALQTQALGLLSEIRATLAQEIEQGETTVRLSQDRIRISVRRLIVSAGAELRLNPNRDDALERVVSTLRDAQGWELEIQAHCSTAVLSEAARRAFGDHTGLTQAKADLLRSEIEEMFDRFDQEPLPIVSARGMGTSTPIDTNSTWQGQRNNDRCEILILPPGWPNMPRPVFPGESQTD
jgi:flagellar motor protein MotB